MLLTTTASASAKPWWLSKYRVTFDNELGIVGNVTLTFASDGGSFIRPITKRYGESNVFHRITDDQFQMLSGSYITEQKDIELRIPELEDEIEAIKSSVMNTDKFVALAKKYVHIQELTPEVLLTFASKIVIHERSEKRSKSATQQIDIYFTHIGNACAI